MPTLYFAAPLFSESELAFNLALTEEIERLGYTVFLPQRDGVDRRKEPWASMPPEEIARAIFAGDRDAVYASDVLLFVLDGRVPDEGACVELGLAYAHRQATGRRRALIGLMTDRRGAFLGAALNPMISGALDAVYSTRAELLAALAQFAVP
jgi:nucleoside 2-deoxyribosyltransferase